MFGKKNQNIINRKKISDKRCYFYRKKILEISQKVEALHIGGSFSSTEILDWILNEKISLKKKFIQKLDYGKEYFKGNKILMIIEIINFIKSMIKVEEKVEEKVEKKVKEKVEKKFKDKVKEKVVKKWPRGLCCSVVLKYSGRVAGRAEYPSVTAGVSRSCWASSWRQEEAPVRQIPRRSLPIPRNPTLRGMPLWKG